jgi:hypothetical protein
MVMTLELSEGTIYGTRYYTVKPTISWDVHGDWGNINAWQEMMEWCVETFDPTPEDGVWTPGARWYSNNAKFWFKELADQEWFVLRWS